MQAILATFCGNMEESNLWSCAIEVVPQTYSSTMKNYCQAMEKLVINLGKILIK